MLACSGEESYHFALFLLCIRGQISRTSPLGCAYIRKGDLTEGFLRYDLGGLIFGGAYFRNFTVYFHVRVKLGVRKRKLSQIRQVSELMNEKLGHRVAMTTALVTIALILSF